MTDAMGGEWFLNASCSDTSPKGGIASPPQPTVTPEDQPPPAEALILISTPAGNDSLFNASIVLPVG